MDLLLANLQKHRWSERQEKYSGAFRYAHVRNEIENPQASVIIISWQVVPGLQETLRLLNQHRICNYHLIFVNNGVKDEIFKPVLPLVDTYISLSSNTGAYMARNIGALFSVAPVLIFLDDDAIIDANFIQAHLEAFEKYKIISVRGVCMPLTSNPLNELAKNHYNLGKRAFPAKVNLEGNCSYLAETFFEVGGWSDEIDFGHGGAELSYRLTKAFPDQRLQIYYPSAVIYHDYAKSEEHLLNKREKQQRSYIELRSKYDDWDLFIESWGKFNRKQFLIKKRKSNISFELLSEYVNYFIDVIIRSVRRFIFRPFLQIFR